MDYYDVNLRSKVTLYMSYKIINKVSVNFRLKTAKKIGILVKSLA